MPIVCPECDNPLNLEEDIDRGETLQCEECGAELEVVSIDPIELVSIDEAGYDDEDVSPIGGEDDE
jgi:alpha-aminoadipate carrier protein LysW